MTWSQRLKRVFGIDIETCPGGVVTVPGHPNDDLAPGTVNSILKQAGLKP